MGIAMGISLAGGGLGICIMALVTRQLLNNYDWRGTLLILGAVNANLCVAGALMRPVNHMYKAKRQRAKSLGYVDVRTVAHKDGKSIPIIKRLRRKYSLSVIATYTKPAEEADSSVISNDTTVTNEKPVFDILEEEGEDEDDKESGLYDIKEEDDEEINVEDKDASDYQEETRAVYSKLNNEETGQLKSSKTNVNSSKDDLSTEEGQSRCCRYPAITYDFFDSIYNFSLFKDPVYVFFQGFVLLGFMGMGIVAVHMVSDNNPSGHPV